MTTIVRTTVNGEPRELIADPRESLLELMRAELPRQACDQTTVFVPKEVIDQAMRYMYRFAAAPQDEGDHKLRTLTGRSLE